MSLACLMCRSLLMSANSIFEGVTEVLGVCHSGAKDPSSMEGQMVATGETVVMSG